MTGVGKRLSEEQYGILDYLYDKGGVPVKEFPLCDKKQLAALQPYVKIEGAFVIITAQGKAAVEERRERIADEKQNRKNEASTRRIAIMGNIIALLALIVSILALIKG